MAKCFGLTKNLNRCGRVGSWKLFCHEHKKQPVVWLAFLTFTAVGGTASILSYFLPNTPQPTPVAPRPTPEAQNRQGDKSDVKAFVTNTRIDFMIGRPSFVVTIKVKNEGELAVFLNSVRMNISGKDGWEDAEGLRPQSEMEWKNKLMLKPFGVCIEPGGTRLFDVYFNKDEQEKSLGDTTINVRYIDSEASAGSINASNEFMESTR
jgi:hypothetical protein